MNYTQVIELLSAPVEIKESVIERIENGDDVSSREIQRLKKQAADLLVEKDSIQSDLIGKQQALDEKQKRLDWLEMDKKAIHEQNDQLRNRDTALIDAKAEAKAAEMKAQICALLLNP